MQREADSFQSGNREIVLWHESYCLSSLDLIEMGKEGGLRATVICKRGPVWLSCAENRRQKLAKATVENSQVLSH